MAHKFALLITVVCFILIRPVCPRTSSVERYMPESEAPWDPVSDLPFLPTCAFAFNVANHLVVMATDSSTNCRGQIRLYDYDIVQNGWVDISDSVSPDVIDSLHEGYASSPTLAATKTSAWIMAYCDTNNILYVGGASVWAFQVNITSGSLAITSLQTHPKLPADPEDTDKHESIRQDYSLVAHKGTLFALGGGLRKSLTEVTCTNHVFQLDQTANIWTRKANMAVNRATLAAVSLGNYKNLFGVGKYNTSMVVK